MAHAAELAPRRVRDAEVAVEAHDDVADAHARVRGRGRHNLHLGGNREIQRRFDASVPRARVPEKNIHASRPFREMIARPKIRRNE